MAVHYRTPSFILSKDDFQEADQVFSIYTKEFGKLKVLGKSIRKIKSKLRSGIAPFYLSEIEFIQGRNYKTLTDAVLIKKYELCDLDKLGTGCRIAKVADDLIKGQENDEGIWDLLCESFEKLDSKIIYHYFLWNLLSLLGYQIDLYNCAHCQNKLLPNKLYFEEGIVCCKQGKEISPEVIKILRLILKKDPILEKLKLEEYMEELEQVSQDYLANIQNICNN